MFNGHLNWWGHHQYGAQHFARCNVCGEDIVHWRPRPNGWGALALPNVVRKKIDAHPCNPWATKVWGS